MSHGLPDPRADRTPDATKAAQLLREQILRGEPLTPKAVPAAAQIDELPPEDSEWEAAVAEAAPERWWQYMPSEAQLLQFLATWLRRRKYQQKTILHVPLAGVASNAQIPITTYYASVSPAQVVLLVDPELGGLQLPPGFSLKLDLGEGDPIAVVYLGSFHPLPGFPFAVMSFLSDDSHGENRSH